MYVNNQNPVMAQVGQVLNDFFASVVTIKKKRLYNTQSLRPNNYFKYYSHLTDIIVTKKEIVQQIEFKNC